MNSSNGKQIAVGDKVIIEGIVRDIVSGLPNHVRVELVHRNPVEENLVESLVISSSQLTKAE
jgi:hypothetical protein